MNLASKEHVYPLALKAYLARNDKKFSALMNQLPKDSVEHSLLQFRSSFLKADYQCSSQLLKKIEQQISLHRGSDQHQLTILADYHFLRGRYRYLMEDTSRKDFLQAETFYTLCRDHEAALRAALNALLDLRESEDKRGEHDASLERIKKIYTNMNLNPSQLFFLHHYEIQYLFDLREFHKIVRIDSKLRFRESDARSSILNLIYICASQIEEGLLSEAQCLLDTLNSTSILDEDLLETIRFLSHFQMAKIQRTPLKKAWIKNLLTESFRDYSEEVLKKTSDPKPQAQLPELSQQLHSLLQLIRDGEQSKEKLLEKLFSADPSNEKAEHRLHNLIYRLRKLHPQNVVKTTYGYRWSP